MGVRDDVCSYCGRRNPGMWGFSGILRRLGNDLGFVQLVILACSAIYVATLLVRPEDVRMTGIMSFLAPGTLSLILFGASGSVPVFGYGRWWTLLSAGWLHGGLLHIGFNMMWVRQLGPAVADAFGPARMVIIYTISGVSGFSLSTLFGAFPLFFFRGAGFTVGASAPILGLLGALVLYGRRRGSREMTRQAGMYAGILILFGFAIPGVDNFAHLGGFIGGYLTAKWLDPFEPERTDHMIAALLCLAASFLSIIASIVHGASILP